MIYNIWLYDIREELQYKFILRKYLRKNPDKSEYDFVLGGVNEYQKNYDQSSNITDEEYIKGLNNDKPKYINDDNIDSWHKQKLQEWKEKRFFVIKHRQDLLDDYKIRLNRLPKPDKKEKIPEERIWFKVGLLFATGEMDKLLKKYNKKPLKVAESLNEPIFEKYILATMNDYRESNTDKNIYYNRDKMLKIIQHCKENNITLTKDFKSKLPLE